MKFLKNRFFQESDYVECDMSASNGRSMQVESNKINNHDKFMLKTL